MGVTIRKKKLKDNWVSIFLDVIHHGYRKQIFLKLKYNDKPSNLHERQVKKEMDEMAKRIALKTQMDLISGEFGIDAINKHDTDFFAFFQSYIESHRNLVDIRCYISTLSKLKAFSGKQKLHCREVTEAFLDRFSKYLQANQSGETAYNYFKKLRRVIKDAVRQKLMRENPSTDIKCPKSAGIEKAVLDFDEIKLLYHTYCSNSEVKRAFLISILTGLRFCDVKVLKWKNIRKNIVDLVQQKTKHPVIITLNADALEIIGKRKEPNGLVFNLPSHNGCLGVLSTWVKNAGIDKNVTWHSARHSFATNLIQQGTDVLITSKLLGHTSLKYTSRYVRVNEALKNQAINKFPRIS